MKVAWPTDYFGDGNSFGYSVHNTEAREALARAGMEIDRRGPVAIHVAPAHRFRPLEGKLNILYTAWESTDLTPDFREGLRRADAVVVTARFLVDAIRKALPETSVHYCPLGVRADDFPFRERRAPGAGGRFRFLWLGAPNARKGWEVVLEAWRGCAGITAFDAMNATLGRAPVSGGGIRQASSRRLRLPPAELYVKTSVTGRLEDIPVRGAPVVFDSRRLSREGLARVYANSHAFLFPSFGEGFGLTMAEAMASGLPVLFTPWSAMRDLADESCGYPLRYELIRHDLAGDGSWPVTFAQAAPEDLLRRMIEVMLNYRRAARKGRLAARRIRRNFTWERTGRTLASIIETECARRGITSRPAAPASAARAEPDGPAAPVSVAQAEPDGPAARPE